MIDCSPSECYLGVNCCSRIYGMMSGLLIVSDKSFGAALRTVMGNGAHELLRWA